ncbi:hypothetical protein MferCBS31731_004769 [Microsporum ferrugineum]
MVRHSLNPHIFAELQFARAIELAAMAGNAPALKAIADTRTWKWPKGQWDCYLVHRAAFNDYVDAVQVLLDSDCPIDKRDDRNMTAHAVAAVCNKAATAKLLLGKGASRAKFSRDVRLALSTLPNE